MMEIKLVLMLLPIVTKIMLNMQRALVRVLYLSLQVWGVKAGPYEFKPAPSSSFNDIFSPLNLSPPQSMEKRIEGSFVLEE